MNILKLFTGPVMSGKTKLMSDFIDLLDHSEYLLIIPRLVCKGLKDPSIRSRSEGYSEYKPSIVVDDDTDLYYKISKMDNLRVVFCDEIQFFTHAHIDQLHRLACKTSIKIYCFGLNSDHKRNKWSTVEYLKDKCINQELTVKCKYCTEIATCNIRYDSNISAESIEAGKLENGEEKYLPCCYKCWVNRTSKN
jgi:thymidine kinase